MKALPNTITILRFLGAICLLQCDVKSIAFWILYALCGISDMVDGWLARKLGVVTKTGALLDSVADICFVACCCWQLLLVLELPHWLWIWAGVIVMIKVINQLSAIVIQGRCSFPHTLANKLTGFLLFLAVPLMFWSIIPIVIVTGIATVAAIHEGHFIRTKTTNKVLNETESSFN